MELIEKEIVFLKSTIPSIPRVRLFINYCLIILMDGKCYKFRGCYSEKEFNQLSDRICEVSLDILNTVVYSHLKNYGLDPKAKMLKMTLETLDRLSQIKLSNSGYERYNAFRTEIIELEKKNREEIEQLIQSINASNDKRCYIATMAYGCSEHPQVIQLRLFRDKVLKRHFLGRTFILIYYKLSPILVKYLRHHPRINKLIRNALDSFIASNKTKWNC